MIRKKKVLTLLGLLILLLAIAFLFFPRFTYRDNVKVHFTMFRAAEQFSRPSNVVRWYMPFAEIQPGQMKDTSSKTLVHDSYTLEIIPQNLVSAIIKAGYEGKEMEFFFVASPDSGKPKDTYIELSYQSTLFDHWFRNGELVKNVHQSLDNLKDYMDDPRQFYGYDIHVTSVTDTSFLFLSEVVPVEKKQEATRHLYDRLIEYANRKNAGYNGVRIFYSMVSGKEITLFASIGITNYIEVEPPFSYKRMPEGKKLLEASYQGPYGEVQKVYTAMEVFKADHNLISMAIPFAKFLNEGYGFSDSQLVQMKVYYPIF